MAFIAQIINGSIDFKNPATASSFQQWKRANEGKRVVIELDKPTRSHSQNAYYWTYLGIIAGETGDNADDLHEFFKRKFLPPRFIKARGQEVRIPGSTTDLSKDAFGEYLDKIAALCGVPLPDPEAAGYIPNSKPMTKSKVEYPTDYQGEPTL